MAKRILVVEDNLINMELVSDLLEASGYDLLAADNAEDGIRIARAEMPDLVLMDVALPGMDGLTATALLKQDPRTKPLRIVALTAHAMKGDEDKALAVGCAGYITKPINTRAFPRLVAEYCDAPATTNGTSSHEIQPSALQKPLDSVPDTFAQPLLRAETSHSNGVAPSEIEWQEPQTSTHTSMPSDIADHNAVPTSEEEAVPLSLLHDDLKDSLLPLPGHLVWSSQQETEAEEQTTEADSPTAIQPAIPQPVEAIQPISPQLAATPDATELPSAESEFAQSYQVDLESPVAPDVVPVVVATTVEAASGEEFMGETKAEVLENTAIPVTEQSVPVVTAEAKESSERTQSLSSTNDSEEKRVVSSWESQAPTVEEKKVSSESVAPTVPVAASKPESVQPKPSTSDEDSTGRRRRVAITASVPLRPRILIVDDDLLNREVLADMLAAMEYETVLACDGPEALAKVSDDIDLILLDVMMPGMDGCEVTRCIREDLKITDIPIIMVTALNSREDRLRSVEVGANDFVTKPVDRTELRVRMKSLLKLKEAQDMLRKHQRELESTIRIRTADLRKVLQQLSRAQQQAQQAHLDTMHRMALAAEFRDGVTAPAHIRCVGNYCAAIARGLDMSENSVTTILHASPIHDIGMLGIPDAVLLKREARSTTEESIYRQHTIIGARILSGSNAELLRAGELIAHSHHEKWNGSGYPNGTAGEDIPLFARICAVADAFDMLTSYRPGYRPISNAAAREALQSGRGRDFDPRVLDAFFIRWEEIEQYQQRYRRAEAPPADTTLNTFFVPV